MVDYPDSATGSVEDLPYCSDIGLMRTISAAAGNREMMLEQALKAEREAAALLAKAKLLRMENSKASELEAEARKHLLAKMLGGGK